MSDYAQRAEKFSLTPKETVTSLGEKGAIFLDVRSDEEVATKALEKYKYVHAWCTMDDTSRLEASASEILPDKEAPVVIFCGIGGRAMGAKKTLEKLGYTQVYNAGGLKDIE